MASSDLALSLVEPAAAKMLCIQWVLLDCTSEGGARGRGGTRFVKRPCC